MALSKERKKKLRQALISIGIIVMKAAWDNYQEKKAQEKEEKEKEKSRQKAARKQFLLKKEIHRLSH